MEIIYNNSFHDHYVVLDEKQVYHCVTSLNYAGNKTFSINKLEDGDVIKLLIKKVMETIYNA